MVKKLISITNETLIDSYVSKLNHFVTKEFTNEITQNQYAKSSVLAMTKDWNLFVGFCLDHQLSSFPASALSVRHFLEHESRTRKYATIRRYTVTITVMHQILGFPDPMMHTEVRLLMMTLRLEKKGDHSQADAFNHQHLEKLNNLLCSSKSIRDIRDLAIYYLMFECVLKRSELRALLTEQLIEIDSDIFVLIKDFKYQLTPHATKAVKKWYALIEDTPSPYLFRSINRHQNIATDKLDDSSIYRILRNAGQRLGLKHLKFSGQSTRIGAARELHQQGMKVRDIQSFGRWQSPVMPSQYVGKTHQADLEIQRYKSFKPWK
jgi:integrase